MIMKRIEVLKTYKLYIGGKFPRTESGRYYTPEGRGGKALGNICQGSRKDFRNAVVAARAAAGGWGKRDPFNRSQILYRIAEMLEGRAAQFEDELKQQGSTTAAARKEVQVAVDQCIYYAGWCDKYQQTFSSVSINRREAARAIQRALAKLSDQDREIVLMRWIEGLCYADIASVLGIEEATARKRHGRVLIRLHRLLKE